jgi:hypothetical protein
MEVITGNWIMTFFCGYFDYNHIMPILDNFFLVNYLLLILYRMIGNQYLVLH